MTQPPTDFQPADTLSWIQVHATVPAAQVDALQDMLLDAGATAITLSETAEEDALWEPEPGTNPLCENTRVTGLFDADKVANSHEKEQLLDQLTPFEILDLRWEGLADREWTREWLKHFKPQLIENKLRITPSEVGIADNTPAPLQAHGKPCSDIVQLLLDPGLAFGTGTHPTTQLCLAWLCQIPLKGKSVIDYGCGSGILGIAALLLGAESVIAIDTDPQALQATQANAEKNGVSHLITLGDPNLLRDQKSRGDVLIANILAEPLRQLRSHFARLLNAKGLWAISGLLMSQTEPLAAAYQEVLQVSHSTQRGDWALIQGNR